MLADRVGQPAAATIRIAATAGRGLRAGDVVELSVIKKLTEGKWAVGLQGSVLPARSQLDLTPGQALRARVLSTRGAIVFAAEPEAAAKGGRGVSTPRLGGDPAAAAARGGRAASDSIAAALLASGRSADDASIRKVRDLLGRTRLEPRRGARAAATLIDKGIDPASGGAAALLELLCVGERGGSDHRRWRGRPFPKHAEDLRQAVEASLASGAPASSLQVYNSLKGRSETWIVLPFVFRDGEREFPGALKLLVDPFARRLRTAVLAVDGGQAGRWHARFELEGARRAALWCDDHAAAGRARREIDTLAAKVHNLGWDLDDTVGDGQTFDGFSPAGQFGQRSVETGA